MITFKRSAKGKHWDIFNHSEIVGFFYRDHCEFWRFEGGAKDLILYDQDFQRILDKLKEMNDAN